MNRWLKKIKKKAILPVAAFLVAAATIGTTFAWQQWDLSVTNNLRSHTTEVTIIEKGKEDGPFDPEKGYKQVSFTNTGSSSVFLRVSYSEYWVSKEKLPDDAGPNEDPHWGDEQNPTYLLSNVTNINGQVVPFAKPVWTSEWETDWYAAGDGWYYYKKILPAGGHTDNILERVGFDLDNLPNEYKNANYRLFFKAEVVQCSDSDISKVPNRDKVNKNAIKAIFQVDLPPDDEVNGPAINYDKKTVRWQ